jgi:23S rRNA pseudouridine1911/1915/1917 synthase
MSLAQVDEILKFEISAEDAEFKRLDLLLVSKLPDLSRSLIKKLFDKGNITGESGKVELKKAPKIGQIISVKLPPPTPTDNIAQNIPLEILYEDEYIIIINKQAGLVIHPAPGNPDGTLVNAILYHCPDLKGIGNEQRPGIVHRLDKGTTGVMVVAKEQKAHEELVKMFAAHNLKRKYEAIVMGTKMPMSGKLEGPIGRHSNHRLKMSTHCKTGKDALTYYRVVNQQDCLTHMEFTLETGRTHQIRVHASELLNAALLNDTLYASKKEQLQRVSRHLIPILNDYEHPMLHAKLLEFNHPITGELLSFSCKRPEPFATILKEFKHAPL